MSLNKSNLFVQKLSVAMLMDPFSVAAEKCSESLDKLRHFAQGHHYVSTESVSQVFFQALRCLDDMRDLARMKVNVARDVAFETVSEYSSRLNDNMRVLRQQRQKVLTEEEQRVENNTFLLKVQTYSASRVVH